MYKNISLDFFFAQESTVALPTFRQSPLVTLRILDRLVCKRHILQLDRKIVQYMDLSQWLKHSKSRSQYWPISGFSQFLMIGSPNVDVYFGLDVMANSFSSNCMSRLVHSLLMARLQVFVSSTGSQTCWSCRLELKVDVFVLIRSFKLRLAFW